MEILSAPKNIVLLVAVLLMGIGAIFLFFAKKGENPSLDVPLISAAGKKIIGGAILFASAACFATALFYPKF